ECESTFGLNETIGIMWRRNGRNFDRKAGGEQTVEGADGGVLSGGVRIKTENHFIDEALDDASMIGGEGGSLWRDDVLDAGHEAGDHVELAFANDGVAGVEDSAFGFV